MTGTYPPNHGIGPAGPPGTGPHPGYPGGPMPGYPGPLPPPLSRPRRSRRGLIAGLTVPGLVLTVLIAAFAGYALRGTAVNAPPAAGAVTEGSAKTAIQNYLDALLNRHIDIVARNTLCGVYDGVTDRRPDEAVAKLSSDAFRKQFAQAEVTSIDRIVYLSDVQAQALFTMRVIRVSGDQRREPTQGVAQLLSTGGEVLVCSLALRTAGAL